MSRITTKAPYGVHIRLTCKNHPELSWTTKNIDAIGCRTIFFCSNWDSKSVDGYKEECRCPASLLEVDTRHLPADDVPE